RRGAALTGFDAAVAGRAAARPAALAMPGAVAGGRWWWTGATGGGARVGARRRIGGHGLIARRIHRWRGCAGLSAPRRGLRLGLVLRRIAARRVRGWSVAQ